MGRAASCTGIPYWHRFRLIHFVSVHFLPGFRANLSLRGLSPTACYCSIQSHQLALGYPASFPSPLFLRLWSVFYYYWSSLDGWKDRIYGTGHDVLYLAWQRVVIATLVGPTVVSDRRRIIGSRCLMAVCESRIKLLLVAEPTAHTSRSTLAWSFEHVIG